MSSRTLAAATLVLETPEGVLIRVPLAGPCARVLALVIDAAVVGAAVGIFGQFATLALPGLREMVAALSVLLALGLSVLYGAALEYFWAGQTIGKHALGLRVMDASGLRLSAAAVLIRNLLRVVDALPVFYLVGGAAMLCGARLQRLGDRLAHTVVAHPRTPPLPSAEAWPASKYNSLRAAPLLCARLRQRTTPLQAQLLLEALRAQSQLDPIPRARLNRGLVAMFQREAAFPPELTVTLSDEQYLRNIAALLSRH